MKTKETKNTKFSSIKGFLFVGISVVFNSTDGVLVKLVNNVHPVQLTLYRFIVFFFLCLPIVAKCGEKPLGPKDVRIYLLLRGVFGGISIYFAYTAFHYLPLGESFVIIGSMPIFVTITAWIFLKEPCHKFQSVLVILTVAGIIFTSKVPRRLMSKGTPYTTENVYGILAALGVLLCRTFMMLCVRKARKVHHSVILFNYSWVSIVENLILLLILTGFKKLTCGIQWFYVFLMGLTAFLGQIFLTLALKSEFAGPVSTVMAAGSIVVAFFWQIFLFQDIPDYFTITGAAIVGFCILLASIIKWASSLPEYSATRKRLRWILA